MLVEIAPLWSILLSSQKRKEALVLATLVDVKGSSYKKPGAMLLVETDGQTHGLLSGGCLEADIAEHARDVFETAVAKVLHYDLSDDSIFGLGAGCDGQITVLLQLLGGDYQPLASLNPLPTEAQSTQLWLNYQDNDSPLGAYCVAQNKQLRSNHDNWQQHVQHDSPPPLTYQVPPKVAVCGAGIDAHPLCQMMAQLHWHGLSFDHRSGLLTTEKLPPNWQTFKPKLLTEQVKQQGIDAIIIMSHNINRDADYLRQAFESDVRFIGLLGPPQRRDKVLSKAGISLNQIGDRLHAPVGLNLGGRLPENIALSICAELQQHFFKS
ncbi:XdhC family protein [Marinicella rhabdoformis]|uniref:XdhC family protein n=1 Tax=Marinicella rhabdoformis TaxID=2580566 RepID=UPI0012AEBFBB|nr:XdhC family protein [Marinicella rhabdoformis]